MSDRTWEHVRFFGGYLMVVGAFLVSAIADEHAMASVQMLFGLALIRNWFVFVPSIAPPKEAKE